MLQGALHTRETSRLLPQRGFADPLDDGTQAGLVAPGLAMRPEERKLDIGRGARALIRGGSTAEKIPECGLHKLRPLARVIVFNLVVVPGHQTGRYSVQGL